MIFGRIKHVKEVITLRHVHSVTVRLHWLLHRNFWSWNLNLLEYAILIHIWTHRTHRLNSVNLVLTGPKMFILWVWYHNVTSFFKWFLDNKYMRLIILYAAYDMFEYLNCSNWAKSLEIEFLQCISKPYPVILRSLTGSFSFLTHR